MTGNKRCARERRASVTRAAQLSESCCCCCRPFPDTPGTAHTASRAPPRPSNTPREGLVYLSRVLHLHKGHPSYSSWVNLSSFATNKDKQTNGLWQIRMNSIKRNDNFIPHLTVQNVLVLSLFVTNVTYSMSYILSIKLL